MARYKKQQVKKSKKPLKNDGTTPKKISRRIRLWIGMLGLVLVISIFYISQSFFAVMESKETLKRQEVLLEQEKQRQSVLESDLLKLEDKEYVKQYAREKFQYTTEDEILFRLPKEEEVDATTTNNN